MYTAALCLVLRFFLTLRRERVAVPPVEMSLLNETGGGKSERLMRVRTHFAGVLSRIRTRKPRSLPQQARHHLERMRRVLCPVRETLSDRARALLMPTGGRVSGGIYEACREPAKREACDRG